MSVPRAFFQGPVAFCPSVDVSPVGTHSPYFGDVPVRVKYALEGFEESLGVKEQRPEAGLVGGGGRNMPHSPGLKPQVGWGPVTLGTTHICFKLPLGEEGTEGTDEERIHREFDGRGKDTQGVSTGPLMGYFFFSFVCLAIAYIFNILLFLFLFF